FARNTPRHPHRPLREWGQSSGRRSFTETPLAISKAPTAVGRSGVACRVAAFSRSVGAAGGVWGDGALAGRSGRSARLGAPSTPRHPHPPLAGWPQNLERRSCTQTPLVISKAPAVVGGAAVAGGRGLRRRARQGCRAHRPVQLWLPREDLAEALMLTRDVLVAGAEGPSPRSRLRLL